MAVYFTSQLMDLYKNNRMSAEYFRTEYRFTPIDEKIWFKIGKCLKKCQYGLSVSMNEEKKGEPIYRLNEIEDIFLSNIPTKYAPLSKREKEEYRVNKKDVLFCRTNGNINYVGRTGIFLGDSSSVFASYLVKSTTKENMLLPEYLTVYLNTVFGRKQL